MSDLAAAAAAMGVPEPIAERSARARAAATGQTYEQIIAAWAGGQPVAGGAAPEPEPEPAPTDAPAESPVEGAPAEAPAVPTAPAQPEAPAAAAAVARPPAPARVDVTEALEYPVVVTVPTAGITERTGFSMPAWLAALFLVIPAFGLIYLAVGASAECGTGTALRVDRVSGELVNCDGSPFEGRGPAGGGTDFIAAGEAIFPTCAGCHGPQGQGQGTFPALTGVLTTFGSCADHIEWVTLGTAGFPGGYGDANKPHGPTAMPGFGGSLSPEQIASVAAFERVRIGGGNPDEVLVDCGLVEPEGEEGAGEGTEEDAGDGETEQGEGTTETTSAPEAALDNLG